ncbi:hypothetical protein BD779DRAFT_1612410 [Infundibulicybe gibba]|nr:hypothetical protein BD779DRAFT_1612410 [Infundibulicybe gibba]
MADAGSRTSPSRFERRLGDTELSYFLPSRESGVNDMYLHLGCRVPAHLVQNYRVGLIWAILRLRHPLLASQVKMHDHADVKFVYTLPQSVEDALNSAGLALEYRTQSKDGMRCSLIVELLDSYLNGPHCDFLICATHFLVDGMASHQFANDFLCLLGGPQSDDVLLRLFESELQMRISTVNEATALPLSLEERFPPEDYRRFHRAASYVDFQRSQEKFIGGHSFPRKFGHPCHTIVPTVSIDAERTKKILATCKTHGVSISNALFAICNVAWAKTCREKWELPMMMYSALNLRPYLQNNRSLNESYLYTAIGYFNVVLPSFLPQKGRLSSTFWHRARVAKRQSTEVAKNPMIIPRSRYMARERGLRARQWAKEDDDKALGVWKAPEPSQAPSKPPGPQQPPSTVLLGLSLLGNLDRVYKYATFPDIQLHTLTGGSRRRSGGMLLFGYTFAGKLWVSLGHDENGFEKETVEAFWRNVLSSMDELLLDVFPRHILNKL